MSSKVVAEIADFPRLPADRSWRINVGKTFWERHNEVCEDLRQKYEEAPDSIPMPIITIREDEISIEWVEMPNPVKQGYLDSGIELRCQWAKV